jgi:hypothetical protein
MTSTPVRRYEKTVTLSGDCRKVSAFENTLEAAGPS